MARNRKPSTPPPRRHEAPGNTSDRPQTRRIALAVAGLWLLALAAYANSFSAGLPYDSGPILLKDPRIRSITTENLRLIFAREYWYPTTGIGLYRPFTTLSYLFNHAVLGNGASPLGYHVVNYLIHAANVSLAFALAMLLFCEVLPAFAAAALWAVHPVLTESVTNVIGRADELAAFGVLAGLLCFARALRSPRRNVWLAGTAAASAIAIFSKESGIVVVGAALLWDLALRPKSTLRTRVAAYAALVLPCVVYLGARIAVLASAPMRIPFTDNPIVGAAFVAGRLTALKVLGRELGLLIWPARLSCDYSYNAIPISTGLDAGVLAAAAALCALAAAAIWSYRRRPEIFFLIALGLGCLLPTANLVFPTGTIMAERFLYIPALAFSGCLAAVAFRIRRTRSAVAVLAVLAIVFGARTFVRNFDWKDDTALWTAAEAVVPASYRPHTSLAEGDIGIALRETNRALAILDPLPDARNTPIPYINAAKVYSDSGDSRQAIALLERAQRIQNALDPATHWAALDAQLGHDSLKTGQFAQAASAFERALASRFTPDLLPELAAALQGAGDSNRAAVALFEALEAQPQNTRLAGDLVALYTRDMPHSCAVLSAETSYRLNKDCPMVKDHMCAASRQLAAGYRATGQNADAERIEASARRSGCAQ